MATIDREGYVQITDRKKDLIKRKGEWISSVDMENAVLAHPGVPEAAVVGRSDEVCDEVPVVFVVRRDHARAAGRAARRHRRARAQSSRKWQLPTPEDIHFVDVAAQDQRRQAGQEGDAKNVAEILKKAD